MGQPVHAAELMGAGIESRADAWLFIGGLIAGFGEPIRDGDGYTDEEIAAAVGHLPLALTEFYRLFGRRPDLAQQDSLLAPHDVVIKRGVLVFRNENEYCTSWGIPIERLEDDDPPVVYELAGGWRPYLERTSLAAVEFALTEIVLGGDDDDVWNACSLTDDLVAHVRSQYTRIAFPDYISWFDSPVCWFSAPGKLLRLDLQPHPLTPMLCVRGRTAGDLAELCADIRGEWTWTLGHGT